MVREYEGWCRRIDLSFRTKYPYLNTRIYKVSDSEFLILIKEPIINFEQILEDFNQSIRFITAPVNLTTIEPNVYKKEIAGIQDADIPSNFEGLPLNRYQLSNHIACTHPHLNVCKIQEDHEAGKTIIELQDEPSEEYKIKLQHTLDDLKNPYRFEVIGGGKNKHVVQPPDETFNIASSLSKAQLNAPYLERDERLWFENVESIYNGTFSKNELYFYDPKKTSCLVNCSLFKNANLRNHLLLYDVVYCVLPLAQDMALFLEDQKITSEEILYLVQQRRLKIVNIQPEIRLDHGFLNEAFQANPSSVISRRAVSALCAIDLMEMNQSYIFSDPELSDCMLPLITELSKLMKKPVETIANLVLWPKQALRSSFENLNETGPMGIPRYGVNKSIVEIMDFKNTKAMEFEFTVNSTSIHLAHALDATYFPFFLDKEKYSDHPYALMMGGMLNLFKTLNYQNIQESRDSISLKQSKNPSIQLIKTFDVNEYIPIHEFENEISSAVIRKGAKSLFTELTILDEDDRNKRIREYNTEVSRALEKKNTKANSLDLGKDVLGVAIPFLSSGIKLLTSLGNKTMNKFPVIKELSEHIEEKTQPNDIEKRTISLLSKINRVARLKKKFE